MILPNMPQAKASGAMKDKGTQAFTTTMIKNPYMIKHKVEIAKAEIEKGQAAKLEAEKAEAARKEAERLAAAKAEAERIEAEKKKAEEAKEKEAKAKATKAKEQKKKQSVRANTQQYSSRSAGASTGNSAGVIATAKKYIGVPYVYGGSTPSGFDCSGFVSYVYKQHGIYLPRSSAAMYGNGTRVTSLAPGDLVFFNTNGKGVSHVGIYVGGNRFISATSNRGVKIDSLSDGYWGPRYLGAKRI